MDEEDYVRGRARVASVDTHVAHHREAPVSLLQLSQPLRRPDGQFPQPTRPAPEVRFARV